MILLKATSDFKRRARLAQHVLEAEDEDEGADGRRLAEETRVDERVREAPSFVARFVELTPGNGSIHGRDDGGEAEERVLAEEVRGS